MRPSRPLRPPTPVEVNLPSRLACVDTGRCEGRARASAKIPQLVQRACAVAACRYDVASGSDATCRNCVKAEHGGTPGAAGGDRLECGRRLGERNRCAEVE